MAHRAVAFTLKKGGPGVGGLAGLLKKTSAPPSAAAAPTLEAAQTTTTAAPSNSAAAHDDDDPLAAFMAEIDNTLVVQARAAPPGGAGAAQESRHHRLEETEQGEGYTRSSDARAVMAEFGGGGSGGLYDDDADADVYATEKRVSAAAAAATGDGELDYDSDGGVVGVKRGRGGATAAPPRGELDPLPRVDHAAIRYEPFRRCFYAAPSDAVAAREAEVDSIPALRAELSLVVEGAAPLPPPVRSFMHLGLHSHPSLLAALAAAGYEAPTAIQSQALPVLLAGRDLIGQAVTGSGKTLGYVLPAVRHAIDQRVIEAGEGPIVLILAPTRELATQIYGEARRFAKPLGLAVALLTGGSSKWEQTKALRAGVEVVVATPGRLIDHVVDG